MILRLTYLAYIPVMPPTTHAMHDSRALHTPGCTDCMACRCCSQPVGAARAPRPLRALPTMPAASTAACRCASRLARRWAAMAPQSRRDLGPQRLSDGVSRSRQGRLWCRRGDGSRCGRRWQGGGGRHGGRGRAGHMLGGGVGSRVGLGGVLPLWRRSHHLAAGSGARGRGVGRRAGPRQAPPPVAAESRCEQNAQAAADVHAATHRMPLRLAAATARNR